MSRSMWFPLSLTLALLAMVPNAAGEEGGKLPSLIPSFDGDRDSVSKRDSSSAQRSAFQRVMDRVMPPTRIERKPRDESALSKLNTGTKRLFAKTKRTLTPWKNSKPKPKQARSSFIPFWPKADQPKTKRNPLTPLFAKKEPRPKPATVPEWLGRPKP